MSKKLYHIHSHLWVRIDDIKSGYGKLGLT